MHTLADFRQSLRSLRRSRGFRCRGVGGADDGDRSEHRNFLRDQHRAAEAIALSGREANRRMRGHLQNGASPVVGPRMFVFWHQRNSVLQEVSAHWQDHLNLMGGNRPELIAADIATADFFRLYGAPIFYGRTFTFEEDQPGGGHVAVLSERIWRNRYAPPDASTHCRAWKARPCPAAFRLRPCGTCR